MNDAYIHDPWPWSMYLWCGTFWWRTNGRTNKAILGVGSKQLIWSSQYYSIYYKHINHIRVVILALTYLTILPLCVFILWDKARTIRVLETKAVMENSNPQTTTVSCSIEILILHFALNWILHYRLLSYMCAIAQCMGRKQDKMWWLQHYRRRQGSERQLLKTGPGVLIRVYFKRKLCYSPPFFHSHNRRIPGD